MKAWKAELKKAIYDRLTTDLKWIVFEQGSVEKDQSYPFVEIGLPRGVESSSKKKISIDSIVPFHVWSNWLSETESDEIEEDIQESITFTNDTSANFLTLTSWDITRQDYESSTTLEIDDDSGHLRHVILEIRFLIESK